MGRNLLKTFRRSVALALVTLLSAIPALAGLTITGSNGITASGADGVLYTGTNGITASGADAGNVAHADGITASGADGTVTINSADGITATGADGITFTIAPQSITITPVTGITVSGADGIAISGADNFVETGSNAITAALLGEENQLGLQGVDPELAVLLNTLTNDSNVDAVIVYHHLPTEADIADLQSLKVWEGTRYRDLTMIEVTTYKAQVSAISHLSAVRSIYGNRTFNWNLEPAARNVTMVERARRDGDLTNANKGLPVSGR